MVRDCSVLYGLGYTNPGTYLIDPTGAMDVQNAVKVNCFDGYTSILTRTQDNDGSDVGC